MCCSSQSSPGVNLKKTLLFFGLTLTNLNLFAQLARSEPAAAVPAGSESLGGTIFWIGAALFLCVVTVGGIILARRIQQQKAMALAGGAPVPGLQKPFSLPNGNGNGAKSLKLNGRPAKAAKLFNNNPANGNAKRRRMFNYHKFYTEMVLQGPSPTSMGESSYNPYGAYGYNGYNGYYVEYEAPRVNNNGHGHLNGNGNGSNSNGHETHAAESHADSSHALAHASLIATQKSLIEEQQRLIHEQARLIEEKSRLIAEKNQLLDRQSQMLDNNLL